VFVATIPHVQRYTIRDFQQEFPDDETCLEWLKNRLYPNGIECPKCQRVTRHHRVMARKSYSCQNCGHHVHPTAGTIFHKSSTPLTLWFYAIFLMSQTRCGISAKQLQRELGVTYKTAWRMFNKIRTLLADDRDSLGGEGSTVEMDETFIGGKPSKFKKGRAGRPTMTSSRKTPVFGIVERSGKIMATVVPDARADTLMPIVRKYVLPKTMIYTDDWHAYWKVGKYGYGHERINHSQNIYVSGAVHTNTIEGFFALAKNGIRGVYHSVSRKHLQSYLNEYVFRYNHREDPVPMFKLVLSPIRHLPVESPA
jgi:transposase